MEKEALKSAVALIQGSIKSHVQHGAMTANVSVPQACDQERPPSHMSALSVVWKHATFSIVPYNDHKRCIRNKMIGAQAKCKRLEIRSL